MMIANIFNPVLAMMIQGYLSMFRMKISILYVKREFLGISLLVVPWCPSDYLSAWRWINVKHLAIKRALNAAQGIIEYTDVHVKEPLARFIIVGD